MRETQFIEQNKEKWAGFEAILNSPDKDPEKLQEVFIQVTDDLSYARTFYPNRSVRVYLNGLAQQIFVSLYQNRKSQRNRFVNFWTDELPQLVYESRRAFLISLLVFLGAFLIGTLSSAMDPEFVQVILGDDYVEMTRANIESGDPMRVYKERDQIGMSLGIAGNNLFVAFLTFVMGIFFMLGSLIVLVSNGIMVGAFQYFFIEQGLFIESFLTIWTHGTLEISAIIIAGAAGITMGRGLVFPGTYSRAKAFRVSARRGVKIMVGVTPIFIMAAFIEGFLTRYTETPDIIRLLFILVCLVYVLGYFVWYPRWKVQHGGFEVTNRLHKMTPDQALDIDWYKVKSISEIFEDAVELYRQHFGAIARTALLGALIYTIISFLLTESPSEAFAFPYRVFGTISVVGQFFINEQVPFLFVLVPAILAIVYYRVFYVPLTIDKKPETRQRVLAMLKASIIAIVTYGVLYLAQYPLMLYAAPLFLSAIFLWAALAFLGEGRNAFRSYRQALALLATSYGKAVGLFLLVALVSLLFFNIMDTMLLGFYFDVLAWIFHFEQSTMNEIAAVALTFITVTMLLLIFQLFLAAYEVLSYTLLEMKQAVQLRQRVQTIDVAKRIQGLEKE